MFRLFQTLVLLYPLFVSVLGRFNSSNPFSPSTYEEERILPSEGRQYSSIDSSHAKSYPSSYNSIKSIGKVGLGLLSGNRRTKIRRVEHSPSEQTSDFEDYDSGIIEKPILYNFDYKYRPMSMGHRGYYYGPPYSHHMADHGAEGKEALAALTALCIGVAAGLGLIGLLSGLLKLFLGPLAFGTLLSLLLVLAAPVPVITNGKMLLASVSKIKGLRKEGLQDTLNEISRKLPNLSITPASNVLN